MKCIKILEGSCKMGIMFSVARADGARQGADAQRLTPDALRFDMNEIPTNAYDARRMLYTLPPVHHTVSNKLKHHHHHHHFSLLQSIAGHRPL